MNFQERLVLTLDLHPRIRVLGNALRLVRIKGVTTTYPQMLKISKGFHVGFPVSVLSAL